MSSSKLSSSSKHRRMNAFLTRRSARASYSFIAIAFLASLGILEGFFHVCRVRSRNKGKKYFFVNLRVLGWSMLLDFDWWSRMFPRMDSLKKNATLDKHSQPLLIMKLNSIYLHHVILVDCQSLICRID